MGHFVAYFDGEPELLFCENETNHRRLSGTEGSPHAKDAFHDYLIRSDASAPSPARRGTKCAAH
jgi:hypothetical protein